MTACQSGVIVSGVLVLTASECGSGVHRHYRIRGVIVSGVLVMTASECVIS